MKWIKNWLIDKHRCIFNSPEEKKKSLFLETLYICFQPIVKNANPSIVEPLLVLLKTLHLEVQFEGECNVPLDLLSVSVSGLVK